MKREISLCRLKSVILSTRRSWTNWMKLWPMRYLKMHAFPPSKSSTTNTVQRSMYGVWAPFITECWLAFVLSKWKKNSFQKLNMRKRWKMASFTFLRPFRLVVIVSRSSLICSVIWSSVLRCTNFQCKNISNRTLLKNRTSQVTWTTLNYCRRQTARYICRSTLN